MAGPKSTDGPNPALSYLWLLLAVGMLWCVSRFAGAAIVERLTSLEDVPYAPALAAFVLIALCSFASAYATRGTPIPSFVVAIALGIAGHALFAPIVADKTALGAIVSGAAAIILFSGGLEITLREFLRLLVKVSLLALPGVLLTGFTFSSVLQGLSQAMGAAIAMPVIILLGAILASTDPAAIIPVLQGVRFKDRATKDIVVAESALNDVAGALLTTAFLKIPLVGLSVIAAYADLATPEYYRFLALQAGYGVIAGTATWLGLLLLSLIKKRQKARYGADQIYFLAMPVAAFVGAAALGGSGFLAAFVAGILFRTEAHMAEIERFFTQVIDGLAKPAIFLLVGAMVDPGALVAYAPVGIAVALIFMFVLRPAMVFLMLGGYILLPNSPRRLSLR
ncbi:MAG: cation:proton antiporter, partial [Alphaproteobacteria bacterium]|nr:cation:proton antiporter [Alphaproteobacteria bacterium]